MASKKFEKGSEEWQFFNDYYKFRQQFYEADNEDEWFQGMMEAGEMLIKNMHGQIYQNMFKVLYLAILRM